jgi:sulfhydrogenase subunit gamma (sulfur reductase)
VNPIRPFTARISAIQTEIEGVKTYSFPVEAQFTARPGQFNMVGYPGVGEAPVSFSTVPKNGVFEHTVKAVGRVTQFLDGLKEGDELLLRGPYGKGWPMKKAEGKDILLIAGGVGLAPIRPVLHAIFENRSRYGDVSLIYGARNEKNLLFMNAMDKWSKEIAVYLTVDEVIKPGTWKHNVGLVTALLDNVQIRPEQAVSFICGPEIMMRFISRGLIMIGMKQGNLYVSMERRMKCGIGHCGHCQHFGLFVCKDGPVFSYNEVKGYPDGVL